MTAILDSPALDLTALAEPDLEALLRRAWAEYDDQTARAAEAEFARREQAERAERERAERARQRRQQHRERMSGWYDAAHAAWLQAEADCRGYLLSRAGKRRDVDPFLLWSASERDAQRWASEELRNWWDDHGGRLTPGAWIKGTSRAARDRAWRDDLEREESAATPEPEPVQPEPAKPPRPVPAEGQAWTSPEMRARALERRRAITARDAERHVRSGTAPVIAPVPATPTGRSGPMEPTSEHPGRWRPLAPWPVAVREAAPVDRWQAEDGQPAPVHPSATPEAMRAALTAKGREVDGAQWLDYVRIYFRRYVHWPSEAALDAGVLWAAHTFARGDDGYLIWGATPRLYVLSSEPDSGKSTVLRLLAALCPGVGGVDVQPTEHGLCTSLGTERPTILLDEADVLIGTGTRKASVQAIINSGYTPEGTKLWERRGRAQRIRTFAPLALAGLDVVEKTTTPHTLALLTRGIKVRMRPAPYGAEPHDLDEEADEVAPRAARLKLAGAAWFLAHRDALAAANPEPAPGAVRRWRQIWRPLLAVADEAGGTWPERARLACMELRSGSASAEAAEAMTDLDELMGAWS